MVLPIMLTSSGFDDLRRSEGVASCSSRSKRAVPVTLWLLLVTDENAGQRSMVTVTRVSVVLSIRVYIDGWKRTVVRLETDCSPLSRRSPPPPPLYGRFETALRLPCG